MLMPRSMMPKKITLTIVLSPSRSRQSERHEIKVLSQGFSLLHNHHRFAFMVIIIIFVTRNKSVKVPIMLGEKYL